MKRNLILCMMLLCLALPACKGSKVLLSIPEVPTVRLREHNPADSLTLKADDLMVKNVRLQPCR